jgi:hypothetical protein
MQNKQSFIDLMEDMVKTNSPEKKLNALYEFLRNEPDFLSKEDQDILISKFKIAKEAKSKAGLTDATKRWKKEVNKKTEQGESRWVFFPSSNFGTKCFHCGERYEIGEPCFGHYHDGKTKSDPYHITCVPQDVKDTNTHYQTYTKNGDDK